ncbi:D-aminoacyl-tRNA deacylase [Xylocopilactobacillus apicola]|uniref:D-aminoacyl-tRNA deacylase n=1 Tax=Xylocopilactobacillus apicola TaxID=2932184 RepID=A0AAU9D9G1_9LACO|nr:D-aminoacyl-tRNA deacylase [Xylocopilactobacillus apicola]BDR58120.1 D-aminoacyl-tRNA deacylase [Xylocopilactobacillus apicola]
MKVVLTTVKSASVTVDEQLISEIDRGFLLLIGAEKGDSEADVTRLSEKISKLRVFEDSDGKTNLSLADVNGEILAVSQFTLAADVRKGNRPSFTQALEYQEAQILYEFFLKKLRDAGFKTLPGVYGANMAVSSINDGPFTLILRSQNGILT